MHSVWLVVGEHDCGRLTKLVWPSAEGAQSVW